MIILAEVYPLRHALRDKHLSPGTGEFYFGNSREYSVSTDNTYPVLRPLARQREGSLHIIGDRRQAVLQMRFLKTHPSHARQAIAALHGAEDFLNSRPDLVDGAIDLPKTLLRLCLWPGINTRYHHTGSACSQSAHLEPKQRVE